MGNDVLCLDLNTNRISTLQSGGIPIHEPGLDVLVRRNVESGRLRFTSDVESSVVHGTLQIIAVGTPPDEDGSADLKHVIAAARNIGRYMNDYKVIVNKSTVPIGTADKVRAAVGKELSCRNVDVPYSVVSNPEFLKEGAAIDDFMRPDRIVIGADDERAIHLMKSLYAPFQRNHERMIVMDVRSAELTKYAANAMLATRISFMNELAHVAERLGADIESVRIGIGTDPRIGSHFLYPGCGYGGSCFPKDVRALIRTAQDDADISLRLLSAVEEVNNHQKRFLVDKIVDTFGSDLSQRHFAIWGLAFKPDTDDMREAPSREVIGGLLAAGCTITAYDPVAMDQARNIFQNDGRIRYASNALDALAGADALIIVTEWKEFRSPNLEAIRMALRSPVIFDGRNLYNPGHLKEQGFRYFPIGRQSPISQG